MNVQRIRKYTIGLNMLLVLCLMALPASALKLVFSNGKYEPMPIAVMDLKVLKGAQQLPFTGKNFADVISGDLERSGLFSPRNPKSFIQKSLGISELPRFKDWRTIKTQALIVGDIQALSGGKVKAQFRVWDVYAGKEHLAKNFVGHVNEWRRLAHTLADEIYMKFTGETAYFDSRIVYVATDGNYKKPRKRLAIMEQDGANHAYLTSGKYMVLSPRFDRNSQRLIYMAYFGRKPSVYLYDLQTGKQELLGQFDGMSFAPRFAPDGKRAILSVSKNGSSNIFEIDLRTKRTKKITYGSAIDTSPSYSADGKQVVFNSDRSGRQHLYVMDDDGDNIRKISRGKGSYATPVWSPRGDLIAFTKMHKGKFHIGVMNVDGSGERLLTSSYSDEGPTWSPNGRVILFSRQTRGYGGQAGQSKLYSIDLTGHNERLVKTLTQAQDPAWSPLLSR